MAFTGGSVGRLRQGRVNSLGLANMNNSSWLGLDGLQLPGNWPWDGEGRGISPPAVHRPGRENMALDWLICISKACSPLGPLLYLRIAQQRGTVSSQQERLVFFVCFILCWCFMMLKHHNIQKIKNYIPYRQRRTTSQLWIIYVSIWALNQHCLCQNFRMSVLKTVVLASARNPSPCVSPSLDMFNSQNTKGLIYVSFFSNFLRKASFNDSKIVVWQFFHQKRGKKYNFTLWQGSLCQSTCYTSTP